MPFNSKALDELVYRLDLSVYQLHVDINKTLRENGSKLKISENVLYALYNNQRGCKDTILDLFYLYAKIKGHTDLKFYQPLKTEE